MKMSIIHVKKGKKSDELIKSVVSSSSKRTLREREKNKEIFSRSFQVIFLFVFFSVLCIITLMITFRKWKWPRRKYFLIFSVFLRILRIFHKNKFAFCSLTCSCPEWKWRSKCAASPSPTFRGGGRELKIETEKKMCY